MFSNLDDVKYLDSDGKTLCSSEQASSTLERASRLRWGVGHNEAHVGAKLANRNLLAAVAIVP